MSDGKQYVLLNKRMEVVDNLIQSTMMQNIEWEPTGDGGYYAQPNSMGVRINGKISSENLVSEQFSLQIVDKGGNVIDHYSAHGLMKGKLYEKLRELYEMIATAVEVDVTRDLDRFLEDLRA